MANKVQTMSSFLNSGVPKVTIQRVLLETASTAENRFIKDPHIATPNIFAATSTPVSDSNPLKVSLTLSIQGLKKKNFKNNPLKNIFDNLDIMSLVTTTVYELNKENYVNIQTGMAINNAFAALFEQEGYGSDITLQDLYHLCSAAPSAFNAREFNLLEQMTTNTNSEVNGDLSRYEYTIADGSIIYNFPIILEPYGYPVKDPSFLAYMTVTEIDSDALLAHISNSIGGEFDFELPAEVDEYIKELNSDISNKGISFDVIFNNKGLNNVASLLQRTDNKEFWFGSYHIMDDGTIMTGNKHNDMSMSPANRNIVLTSVLLPNAKIIDLRDDEEIEKIFLKELFQLEDINNILIGSNNSPKNSDGALKRERPQKFSVSYKSIDAAGAPAYLFGLNKTDILLNKSLLGGIAQNLETGLAAQESAGTTFADFARAAQIINEALDNTSVEELKVYRKRIQTNNFGENRLGTLKAKQESFMNTVLDADIENSYFDSVPVEVASYTRDLIHRDTFNSIQIEKLDGFNFSDTYTEKQNLFFSFKDQGLVGYNEGNYEYSYELIIKDGILAVLSNRLKTLMSYRNTINTYVNLINSNLKLYYDEDRDKFNTEILLGAAADNVPDTIDNILQTIAEIIILFNVAADISSGIEKLYKISNPITGNYQGLLKFVSIYETFVEKIQKISGLNTSINKYIDLSASLQKNYGEIRSTIKVNETFLDIVSLENKGVGYQYILNGLAKMAASTNAAPTIMQLDSATLLSLANLEFNRYFSPDASNTTGIGNTNSANKLRYFTPSIAFLAGNTYSTTSDMSPDMSAAVPFLRDFDYYKPIILDILEYYLDKEINKVSSSETKTNIRRLINIASKYSLVFNNEIFKQLGFLADPISSQNGEGGYFDSSKVKNQQQTGPASNMSGLGFDFEEDAAGDYNDMDLDSEINVEIEGFLFGMLSNIILGDHGRLPEIYKQAQLISADADILGNVENFPTPIQALFVEFNPVFIALKQHLLASTNISFDSIKDFPLSLSTFGWWWFNYSNIVEIRYISGLNIKMDPVWRPLTVEALNNTVGEGKRIICKLFKYENTKLGITNKNIFLDLPILDQHFIVNPLELILPQDLGALSKALTTKKESDSAASKLGEDFFLILNGDSKVTENKNSKGVDLDRIEKLYMSEDISRVDTSTNNKAEHESGPKHSQDLDLDIDKGPSDPGSGYGF